MLSSIHPLGERAKGNRFGATATAFVVGSVAGGLTTGATASAVGGLLRLRVDVDPEVALAAAAIVSVLGAILEATGHRLPSVRRQVDENWLHEFRGWVYGAGFGFQLGAGVLTFITSAAVYVFVVTAIVVPSPAAALSIGALFGLVRGASILAVRQVGTSDALVAFHRRLQSRAAAVRFTSVAGLVVVALTATASLV